MRITTKEFRQSEAVKPALQQGICAGTTIMTLQGEMPVEQIAPGDRIITRDTGMAVLKDITVQTAKVAPIRIKAGSLGHTRPDRDMIVAPEAQIYIRDWRAEALFGKKTAAVSASRLVDGEFLAEQDVVEMKIYTLVFDDAHIIYADGIEMVISA